MGLGIWSMHYIGMLAFSMPMPVLYDWPTVLLSLLAAIFASAVALYVVSRQRMAFVQRSGWQLVMGAGIALMHYIGMAAMRMDAMCHYSASIVMLSVVLAIVISFVGLWLVFYAREETKGNVWRKIGSAIDHGRRHPGHALHRHGCGHVSCLRAPRPTFARGEHHRTGNGGDHYRDDDGAGPGGLELHRGSQIFRTASPADRGCRSRQPGQERVPGQYEPRDSHAA